jgi:hypothetical protein
MYRPVTRVRRRVRALDVSDFIPWLVVANMWRPPTRIPVQKEARPMMMMHGLRFAGGWHGDLEDADERILEYDPVTPRRRRHGVISLRKIRLILRKTEGLPSEYGDEKACLRVNCNFCGQPTRTCIGAHGTKGTVKSNRFLQTIRAAALWP